MAQAEGYIGSMGHEDGRQLSLILAWSRDKASKYKAIKEILFPVSELRL